MQRKTDNKKNNLELNLSVVDLIIGSTLPKNIKNSIQPINAITIVRIKNCNKKRREKKEEIKSLIYFFPYS